MKKALLLLVTSVFAVCCQSLKKENIEQLTHCETNISQVRRNLLKTGYELRADEKDIVSTNFQMSDFGFSDRSFMPPMKMGFVVTKVSEKSVKIKTLVEDKRDAGPWIRELPYNSALESEYREVRDELCKKSQKLF